jgi:hypothetical protein
VLRQHLRHERLELDHLAIADLSALFLRERLLERPALIHGGCRNHAAAVGHRFHALKLAC